MLSTKTYDYDDGYEGDINNGSNTNGGAVVAEVGVTMMLVVVVVVSVAMVVAMRMVVLDLWNAVKQPPQKT